MHFRESEALYLVSILLDWARLGRPLTIGAARSCWTQSVESPSSTPSPGSQKPTHGTVRISFRVLQCAHYFKPCQTLLTCLNLTIKLVHLVPILRRRRADPVHWMAAEDNMTTEWRQWTMSSGDKTISPSGAFNQIFLNSQMSLHDIEDIILHVRIMHQIANSKS